MSKSRTWRRVLLTAIIGPLALVAWEVGVENIPGASSASFFSAAQAIIGRPLTPVSVAGVARRTARRVY